MPIWEWKQLWHVCHKDLWSKRNSGWSFTPQTLSITKFIIDRGATVPVMLSGTHYRRSFLIKGGLETPCKVSVSMCGFCLNVLLLERYKQLSKRRNSFSFLTIVQEPERQNAKSKKSRNNAGKKRKSDQQQLPSSNDIRN